MPSYSPDVSLDTILQGALLGGQSALQGMAQGALRRQEEEKAADIEKKRLAAEQKKYDLDLMKFGLDSLSEKRALAEQEQRLIQMSELEAMAIGVPQHEEVVRYEEDRGGYVGLKETGREKVPRMVGPKKLHPLTVSRPQVLSYMGQFKNLTESFIVESAGAYTKDEGDKHVKQLADIDDAIERAKIASKPKAGDKPKPSNEIALDIISKLRPTAKERAGIPPMMQEFSRDSAAKFKQEFTFLIATAMKNVEKGTGYDSPAQKQAIIDSLKRFGGEGYALWFLGLVDSGLEAKELIKELGRHGVRYTAIEEVMNDYDLFLKAYGE
jgi:hypothetical protein